MSVWPKTTGPGNESRHLSGSSTVAGDLARRDWDPSQATLPRTITDACEILLLLKDNLAGHHRELSELDRLRRVAFDAHGSIDQFEIFGRDVYSAQAS